MTDDHKTPEIDALASRLDALGETDGADAPAGLERRVVDAAMRTLEAETPAPIPIETRRVRFMAVARLAAAVLVIGGAGAAWYAFRPTAIPSGESTAQTQLAALSQDVDDLLALSSLLDEHAGLWGSAIQNDADTLDKSIGQTWDSLESIADEFAEESI